eukprot:TRINITY_DN847_c0_g1_i1.p1 TRINITY_DN847_c0_g1~~TRINITY_DN847_c0_g1_i1.p1  ORF type:complete len:219 (-),score=24.22 TRINITY_DN847_c0_g1_i1:603-1259(-)
MESATVHCCFSGYGERPKGRGSGTPRNPEIKTLGNYPVSAKRVEPPRSIPYQIQTRMDGTTLYLTYFLCEALKEVTDYKCIQFILSPKPSCKEEEQKCIFLKLFVPKKKGGCNAFTLIGKNERPKKRPLLPSLASDLSSNTSQVQAPGMVPQVPYITILPSPIIGDLFPLPENWKGLIRILSSIADCISRLVWIGVVNGVLARSFPTGPTNQLHVSSV